MHVGRDLREGLGKQVLTALQGGLEEVELQYRNPLRGPLVKSNWKLFRLFEVSSVFPSISRFPKSNPFRVKSNFKLFSWFKVSCVFPFISCFHDFCHMFCPARGCRGIGAAITIVMIST